MGAFVPSFQREAHDDGEERTADCAKPEAQYRQPAIKNVLGNPKSRPCDAGDCQGEDENMNHRRNDRDNG